MAKRKKRAKSKANPKKRGGGGKAKKPKKPALQKSGRAQAAAEPEGSRSPKDNPSKSMAGALKGLAGSLDSGSINELVKKARGTLGKFKRSSTRSKYEKQLRNLASIQKGLVKAGGGARKMRGKKKQISDIMKVLNKRNKAIGRKLKSKKATKAERAKFQSR